MRMSSNSLKTGFIFLVIILLHGCGQSKTELKMDENPLLKEWTGPYGGVPSFNEMNLNDLKEALIQGMDLKWEEIEVITHSKEEPNFENTIVALEKSGKALDRVFQYYGIFSSNLSSPEFREIEAEMAPVLSEFQSKITQNSELFERIKSVYDASQKQALEPDQQRTVELIYTQFAMNGAELDSADKVEYARINKELSSLYTRFSNNVLHDEENYITFLNEDQLGGLPEAFIKSAAGTANDKGEPGKYAITNTRSSMDPFLTYSTERELRKQVWNKFYSRGDNNDQFDNKELITEILQKRRRKIELLGFENYAQWRLQDRMAKTPENAMALMEAVWPAAIARVHEEVSDMQEVANRKNNEVTIEPWDYRYYAEQVRKEKYDLNSDEVKQYLQLDKLTEAMHFVALKLFNYQFIPVPEGTVPVFHADVKVWEVIDATTSKHIGLWYLDPYSREGKRSGAWATMYRSQSSFEGEKTVLASNNSNFIKPAPGEALLISWDDAITFFHEFGHALHFFSSQVRYPILNSGVRDYTEFQSQLLERWLSTDEVIENYLVHNKTGEPIPAELIAKIKKAANFNQGFSTTEYLASALMDMKLHLADPAKMNVSEFEKKTLQDLKMPKELPMRHRTPQFSHVFSGEGYATAYYGYMWADVLTADAAEAFAEAPGGFYDEALADKLVQYLFAPRNSIDPSEAYLLFRGRPAKIEALMRDRGFPVITDNE